MKRRGKKNINLLSFREREREKERETGRQTEKEREISGEHDNISENLRIFVYILRGTQMSLTIVVLFEAEDASLIY